MKFSEYQDLLPLEILETVHNIHAELLAMGFTEEIKEAKSGPVLSYMTELKKATDCKKLNGLTCTSTCPGGYTYTLDDELLKKCRSMAFLMTLNQKTAEYTNTYSARGGRKKNASFSPGATGRCGAALADSDYHSAIWVPVKRKE